MNVFKLDMRILLLVSLLLYCIKSNAEVRIKVICKNDGIRFVTKPDTATGLFPDIVLWTITGGDISSSNMLTTNVVTYANAGQFYTYNQSTFNSTGKTNYDTFLIIVKDHPIPAFSLPNDTGYCNGQIFNLALKSSSFPGVKHEWSTGDTALSINITSAGTYWLKATVNTIEKGYTCDSVYKEITVVEYQNPTVNLGADKTMCQNQTIVLDAKGTGTKYLWKPNGEVTKTITATLPGIYTVEVSNADNCKATDDIELIDSCPHYVFIPDAVSPNADLLNDAFVKVWNFTPKDYTFSIYDRWGELIFETTDVNAAWNCKVNDELVQQDIYVYKITYVDTDKKFYELRGTFLVVR